MLFKTVLMFTGTVGSRVPETGGPSPLPPTGMEWEQPKPTNIQEYPGISEVKRCIQADVLIQSSRRRSADFQASLGIQET
jgi:hypothetical protein